MNKWNHYVCRECGGTTIARHDDEGTTPFIIRCRAQDRVIAGILPWKGCDGNAESSFFTGPQNDDQTPHVVFFRPPDAMDAIEFINMQPKRDRVWWLEHYQKGGALMREAER